MLDLLERARLLLSLVKQSSTVHWGFICCSSRLRKGNSGPETNSDKDMSLVKNYICFPNNYLGKACGYKPQQELPRVAHHQTNYSGSGLWKHGAGFHHLCCLSCCFRNICAELLGYKGLSGIIPEWSFQCLEAFWDWFLKEEFDCDCSSDSWPASCSLELLTDSCWHL